MIEWLRALPETTLFYRNNSTVSRSQIIGLLGSSGLLLTLCRLPLGFSILIDGLLVALGESLLMLSGLLFLLRGGTDPVSEALKLSRLILVTWTVCLILFVHNLLPETRIPLSTEYRPFVYALAATSIIVIHTLRVERNRKPFRRVDYWHLVAGFLVLSLLLTAALYLFVLSEVLSEIVEKFVSS